MSALISPQLWSDGQCPPEGHRDDILKWFKFAHTEARSYLDSQPGVEDIAQALSIIRGKFWCQEGYAIAARSGLSSVYFNRANVQSEKLCFTLTNLAPGFKLEEHSSDDVQLGIAKSLDKQVHEWLESPKSKSSIRRWLLNHRLGVSYISPVMVDPLLCEAPSSGIECKIYNYDEVLFYQMGHDLDHQKAEATIIENHVPLERVRKVYNLLSLPPDSEARDVEAGIFVRGMRKIRNLWDARNFQFGVGKWKPQRMKTVFHVYVNDKTLNTSGYTRTMGQILNPNRDRSQPIGPDNPEMVNTHWSYDVPSYRDIYGRINTVPSGVKNPDGSDVMRLVEESECQLYPTRRLIIIIGQLGSDQTIWYDGPSWWAHGLVPIVPMRAQDNGIDHMAGSMFRDITALNAEYNRVLRGVLNKVRRIQEPNMLVNEKFGPDKAKLLSAGYPGQYFMWNNFTGMEACRPAWPDEFYKIAPEELAALEKLERMIDFMLGINDPQALMEKTAGKLPESDSIEDLYQTKGEVMEDRGRRMENGWLQLGYMITMLMAQFDSLPRRLAVEGDEGLSPADLDKDPSNMIPSHLPGEDTGRPSAFSRMMRTRYYMRRMAFKVDANTAYGFSNSEQKLELELLRTRGFPVPFDEEARVYRFESFGEFPGATWLEKFAAQTQWQAKTQGTAVSLGQVAGQLVQAAAGLQAIAGQLGGGGGQPSPSDAATATHHGTTGSPTGRPPSYQEPPQQESKDGGNRQTITTSQ